MTEAKDINKNNNKELSELRLCIDDIDGELMPLLSKRLETAREIGAIKKQHNISVTDEAREAEILGRIENRAGEEYGREIKEIYKSIFECSKIVQSKAKNK